MNDPGRPRFNRGHDRGRPFSIHNPWRFYGGVAVGVMLLASVLMGFLWIPARRQGRNVGNPAEKRTGWWATVCRGLGITDDETTTRSVTPPPRWASDVAWSAETVRRALSGNVARGEFVAFNCTVCHGEHGSGSGQTWIPKLAGQDRLFIYKQLADFRNGRRQWGVMNAVASALSEQDRADVAAYFSAQEGSEAAAAKDDPAVSPERLLRARRLAYAGDPIRHVSACATCHGPRARIASAPVLAGQYPTYLEMQLGTFAQGFRANDAHSQMRAIAGQLSSEEMHSLAVFMSQNPVRTGSH